MLYFRQMESRNIQEIGEVNHNTMFATIQGDVAEKNGGEQ